MVRLILVNYRCYPLAIRPDEPHAYDCTGLPPAVPNDMRPLTNALQDVRHALRALWRAKAFAVVTIATLTVGITMTVVMFAIVHHVVLRPLPVVAQDRLVVVWKELRASGFAHFPFGGRDVKAAVDASQIIERGAGVASSGVGPWTAVDEDGTPTYVNGALVTGAFFEVLGTPPALGRAFTPSDDVWGAEHVVVISHGLWKRRYGGSPDAIGRRMALEGTPFRIVGVMPAGLDYPKGVEVWRTVGSVPKEGVFGEAAHDELDLIARIRGDASIEHATGELAALLRRLERDAAPGYPRGLVPVVRPLETVIVGDVRPALTTLFGAAALVLLVAIANVANLLLLRSETRTREIAIRRALGAPASRVLGLVAAEALVLASMAGVAAVAAAAWVTGVTSALLVERLPRSESIRIDGPVAAFTLGLVLLATLLATLVPLLASRRQDIVRGLRPASARRPNVIGRRVLVAAQVCLAVIVVAGAGLLMRSLLKLQTVDAGFSAEQLLLVDLSPGPKFTDPAYHARFLQHLTDRLEAAPPITSATPVNLPPFSGLGGWDVPRFTVAGQSGGDAAANPSLNLESVHANYFETFRIQIVRGRGFSEADREGALRVAIISEDVAARVWPHTDPIGRQMKMGGPESAEPWLTIVGIAAPTRYRDLREERPTLYVPAYQFLDMARLLAVRSTAPLAVTASAVREHVRAVDPGVQVVQIRSFPSLFDEPLATPRLNAALIGTFGAAALFLAIIGAYAVLAAFVRQRDREIGIRVALGATARDVRRLVLGEAFRFAAAGAGAGFAGALLTNRVLRVMLFEVHPVDVPTLLATALLLVGGCVLAAYMPTRRAVRIDPAAMLRRD